MCLESVIRVFISYAWENESFRESVWELAGWLEGNSYGRVKVISDHLHSNRPPSEGWPNWMLNEINKADVVLIICSPKYCQRFSKSDIDASSGLGVTFEGAIITQKLYDSKLQNVKFFPILPDGGNGDDIPVILKAYNNWHSFPNKNSSILKLIFNENPKHETSIFLDGLTDKEAAELKNGTFEKLLIEEILTEEDLKEKTMLSPKRILVRSYLSLNEINKINILRELKVYDTTYNTMRAHERDKQIFNKMTEQNLFSQLWEEINKIKPFEDNINPFKNSKK